MSDQSMSISRIKTSNIIIYGLSGFGLGIGLGLILLLVWLPYKGHQNNLANSDIVSQENQVISIPFKRGPIAPFIKNYINQAGDKVNTRNLLGKLRIITFLDPLGDHHSPVIVENLMNLYQELKTDGLLGKKVIFISYNLNPMATPKQCAEFLNQVTGIHINKNNWLFLTPPREGSLKSIMDSYGIKYKVLNIKQYQFYTKHQKREHKYMDTIAVNSLHNKYPYSGHIVNHDKLIIVGPRDHIWARLDHAASVSDFTILTFVPRVLKFPGMQ